METDSMTFRSVGRLAFTQWVDFINVRSKARNDLAIFLRDTQHLKDICIILWLGPALLGIHLTEPYLSLLIDQKATHLDLLEVFLKLHSEPWCSGYHYCTTSFN